MASAGTVLLTGGAGLLAHDLAPALRAAGHAVATRTHEQLDIADAGAVAAALDEARPEVVVNAAAYTDVDGAERHAGEAERANVRGPEVLARACAARDLVLVHLSTDYVFDGEAGRPYREDDPPRPLGVYGRTKLEGERRVRAALAGGHLIVRTSWLYGAHGRCFPRAVLRRAMARQVLDVVADQEGCPTWTVDLAGATVALIAAGARGTVHAAAPEPVSRHGWAEALVVEARRHAPLRATQVRAVPTELPPGSAVRPRRTVLDGARLRELTGLVLPSWPSRLAPFVRAMLATGASLVLALALTAGLATAGGCGGCPLYPPVHKAPAMPVAVPVTAAPAAPRDALADLRVRIDGAGFTVSTSEGSLGNASGEPGPTVPCREPGCPTVESYDLEALRRVLAEVEDQYPETDSILIEADAAVTYEVVVLVLDAVQADGGRSLFPNVSLAVDGDL